MGSEFSTPTVVVGGATVAAGIVGAALYAKQHPDTPEVASQAVTAEKDKGKGKGAVGGGRKRKGGSSLAGSTKRLGGAPSEKNDDTPPALAAQAALFDASAEKGRSSAMEDVMASTTSVASKSSRRKRGRKPKAPAPAEQKEVEAEEEEEEEEEDEATPEPTMVASSSAFGGSSKDKRGQNKFSSLLAESQYAAKPSMDASWLQVDKARAASAKRRKQQQQKAAAEVSSDAGLTASATGDESHSERGQSNSMQALAGKIGHVQPKTQVDDMLLPEPTISRVMRVESAPDDDLLHSTDADAEEEGWGIVRRRRASPNPASTPPAEPAPSSDELNKDQRRREARKDATKVAKADAEADRLKRLAQHKKEQERAKIEEMRKKELSAKKGKEAKISGGMKAVVQDGKLVWE